MITSAELPHQFRNRGPGGTAARVGGTIHALGANQREHALGLPEVKTTLANVQTEMADFRQESRATFRSVDEQLAEIKDLITGRRHVQ